MDPEDAVTFFQSEGIHGTRAEIGAAIAPYGRHPLSLRLLAGAIRRDPRMRGDIQAAGRHTVLDKLKGKQQHHILQVAYDEMDEEKRNLLSRFAAFRSPMDYEALLHLNPFKSEDEFEQALEELESRGLLFIEQESGHCDLHPIVRQYAYDRLGDKEGVHSQLRDYFDALPAPDKVESVDDLAPVIELYHHTVSAGGFDNACHLYYDRLGDPLLYRFGAYQKIIELLGALFPGGEARPPRLKDETYQAWTLAALANAYGLSGQPRRAVPLHEAHNTLREKADDKRNLAAGLGNLALEQAKLGELEAAERNLRRPIELSREIKDEFKEAVGQQNLGRLLAYEGRFDEAAQELEAAAEAAKFRHKQNLLTPA